MTISAESFISPGGNITGEMFPGEDLEERVQGYLDALTLAIGITLTGEDLDSALYYGVYVKAYEAAAVIAVEKPTQGALVDQGSAQWAQNRADQYLKLAEKYQKLYDAVFVTDVTPAPPRYPSGSVPTRITAP